WADPHSGIPGLCSSQRGDGIVTFGSDITQRFLQSNDLNLVIRSHECQDNGFEWAHDKRCLTVFSAPNYCDEVGNQGAVIRLRAQDSPGMDVEVRQFGEAKKPKNYVECMAYAGNIYDPNIWGLIQKAEEEKAGIPPIS
ncbi:unnamed protein product, partial [Effrenium voratum]